MFLLIAMGCAPEVSGVSSFEPGVYTGLFELELVADFGLWKSDPEVCREPMTVVVDPDHDVAPIRSRLVCTTPSLGANDLDLKGYISDFPLIYGELASTDRSSSWEGMFTAEDEFHGELIGEDEFAGVRITYTGWFVVCLDAEELEPGTGDASDSASVSDPAVLDGARSPLR